MIYLKIISIFTQKVMTKISDKIGSKQQIKIDGYPVEIGQIIKNTNCFYVNIGGWIQFEDDGVNLKESQLRRFKSLLYKWAQECYMGIFSGLIINKTIRDCEVAENCFDSCGYISIDFTFWLDEDINIRNKAFQKKIQLFVSLIIAYLEDNEHIMIKPTRKSTQEKSL